MTAPEPPDPPPLDSGVVDPGAGVLESSILGAPTLDAPGVAERAGVTVHEARRLWRALGFPDAPGQMVFTESDAEALRVAAAAGSAGRLDADTVVRMTRAVGQQLARLAEWEVALLWPEVEHHEPGTRTRRAEELLQAVGGRFEELLVYAWRRHLAAAVARKTGVVEAADVRVPSATIGFADLVRFSEMTNQLDDDQIGDLVEVFESRAQDVVASRNGRVVKTLGDSVLFLADNPVAAADTGLDIIGVIGGDDRLPDVRVGLASGPVVLRMGDVYGPAVNLAARLLSVARRNRLVVDTDTADLLPIDVFDVRRLPARRLRGFGEVVPVSVRRTRSRHAF